MKPDTPLSLAHLSELETPPLELVDAAAKAGFASIGLRTAPASPGGIVYPLSTESEQEALRQRLADTGLTIQYIELITLTADTRAADYLPMFEVGAAIGATRLAVAGDSRDFATVASKLAEICDAAADFGLMVDLEFMPYRGVASFSDAAEVVERADRPNAFILLDALHFERSGSDLTDLRNLDPKLLGTFQICDGPKQPPADLVAESRLHRSLPGEGEFALGDMIDALPADLPLGVEVPLYTSRPDQSAADRLTALVRSTRNFLTHRSNA